MASFNPEELLQCPFDPIHQIRAKRFQYHLVKCSKQHQKPFYQCANNARHVLTSKEEYEAHKLECPDRKHVEAEVRHAMGHRSQFKGCTHLPKYDWKKPKAEENWESSSDSDSEVAGQQFAPVSTVGDKSEKDIVTAVQAKNGKQVQAPGRVKGTGRGHGRASVVETPRAPGTGLSKSMTAVSGTTVPQQERTPRQQQTTLAACGAGPTPVWASGRSLSAEPATLETGFLLPSSSRPPPPGLGPPTVDVSQQFGLTNSPLQRQYYQLPSWQPQPLPVHRPAVSQPPLQAGVVVGFGRGGRVIAALDPGQLGGAVTELYTDQFGSPVVSYAHQISGEPTDPHGAAESDNGDADFDQTKKVRKLQKLLNQIAVLQEKQERGQELDQDQVAKMNRKGHIEEELRELQIDGSD